MKRPYRRCSWLLAAALLAPGLPAAGHELHLAQLSIVADATEEHVYRVQWQSPSSAGHLRLEPSFPAHCAIESVDSDPAAAALLVRLTLRCPDGIAGGVVAVEGLPATIADVLVDIVLEDGRRLSHLLSPSRPSLVVGEEAGVPSYLVLGVEHLLLGFDHILFVIALMFFVSRLGPLVKAITAFTAAHSVTLALSALGTVTLASAPVEAVIALSILFLAVEKLRQRPGSDAPGSITATHTWVVAFAFGLLHGFGFAGALADIGLPQQNLLLALFLFNVGVELGQLAVVAVALGGLWLLRRTALQLPALVERAPLYAAGTVAAYWFVARTVQMVN